MINDISNEMSHGISRVINSGMKVYTSYIRLACALATLALMIILLTGALASETVTNHIQQEIPNAKLSGQGSFRWFGLKIYDAQLWVGKEGYDTNKPLAEKFALDLRYARTLEGKKIAQASDEQITKLGIGSAAQRTKWLEEMLQLFPDVSEGTHLTGIYLPQHGTDFYLDGRPIGTIKDDDFAHAFFAIWLTPETSEPQLRKDLLKNAAPH